MHVDAIYVIEPKPELVMLLRDKTNADFAGFMSDRTCFHSDEGGRTAWDATDYELRMKLVFLCTLLDHSPLSEPESFRTVFGNTPLSEALFDRWWTIERLEFDDDRSTLEKEHSNTIARLAPTSNELVNGWIGEHRDSEQPPADDVPKVALEE